MKYLLRYKFSQDHTELFFCAVRGRGRWNNNPTVRQFKVAYKRLLMHQNVKAVETGNCIPQEQYKILAISSRAEKQQVDAHAEYAVDQRRSRINYDEAILDHDYSDVPDLVHSLRIVVYIGGFVVQKLLKVVYCDECLSALLLPGDANSEVNSSDSMSGLLLRKNRGGLLTPSADVVFTCSVRTSVLKLASVA